MIVKHSAEFALVEGPPSLGARGRPQFDKTRLCSRQNGIRPIVLIEGLENHDLVARIAYGEQSRNHGLSRTAANRNVLFRICRNSLPVLGFAGYGLAQALGAPGDRILVNVGSDRVLCRLFDLGGSRKVRETLCEIDRTVQHRLASHFANYRFGEVLDASTEEVFGLRSNICHGLKRLAQPGNCRFSISDDDYKNRTS